MIESQLREQMLAATAADTPSPDLLRRVHAGVRRSQARGMAVVGGVAVAAVAASASLAAGGVAGGVDRGARDLAVRVDSAAPPQSQGVGPTDEELRAAQWFSYVSQPDQPGMQRAQESRWQSRDGRHVLQYGDGPAELINESSAFPFGADGVSFDELLALPADPAELDRRMREAQGGRPDTERVLDQVKQLLGRSPALRQVRKALLDAALLHEGVTATERERDPSGRAAILVEHTDRDGAVLRLWVDPRSFRLLEEQLVAGPGFPKPGPTDPPAAEQEQVPRPGDILYRETFLSWGTEAPPAS